MSSRVAAVHPAWAIPGYLEVSNGHLAINGVDAIELIREYESPLFVFPLPAYARIFNVCNRQRLRSISRSAFSMPHSTNSNMAVLKTVRDAGIDIEVNSGSELFKALRVGFRPDQIIFNGTSKVMRNLTRRQRRDLCHQYRFDFMVGLVEEAVKRARNLRAAPYLRRASRSVWFRDWDSLASGITDSVAYFEVRHFVL